jgi:2-dehydro-3-deoxygluconokinase
MVLLVPEHGPLAKTERLVVSVAGAESNVACGLAHLGVGSEWFSRVGEDPWGDRVVDFIRARGVLTRRVVRDPGYPTGIFFKDHAGGRTRVHYYRRGSAAAHLSAAEVRALLHVPPVLTHVSGITAALSLSAAEAIDDIVQNRVLGGSLVSFDVNYRPGLWSPDAAGPVLRHLARASDIVLVGFDEAETVWGAQTLEHVRELVPEPSHLVVKDGPRGATHYGPEGTTFVPAMPAAMVEPVGAGDAFAAGFLAALVKGEPTAVCLRLGHLMAALTMQDSADLPELPPATQLWSLARDRDRWTRTHITRDSLTSLVPTTEESWT